MDKYNYCGNCNFFRDGQCHKYTPQVIPTTKIDPNFGDILMSETVWPEVLPDQHCGEWEAYCGEQKNEAS